MRFPSFKLCQSFQGPMNTSKPSALHVTFRPSSPVTMMPRDNTCSSYGSVSEVPLAPLLLVFIPERLSSCRGERLSFRWQGSNPTPKDIALSEQELKPLLNLRNNYMFAFRPLGHWTSARSWWHCQIPALTAKGGHNKDTSSTTSKGTGMRFNIINLSFCSFKWIKKKTKSRFYVLPLRSLRGGRLARLDTILSNRVASSILDCNSGYHRTGAK